LYCNASKNIIIDTKIYKSVLKGNFYKDKFDLHLSITNYVNKLRIQSKTYLENIPTQLDCNIDVDSNNYFIKKANLSVNNCPFNVTGWILKSEQTNLDLSISTTNINIKKTDMLIILIREKLGLLLL
jgi:hypothetical protein